MAKGAILDEQTMPFPDRAVASLPRVAVIGCGYWGKNLVRNFAELGALAAICDPDREAATQLADRHRSVVAEFWRATTAINP